MPGDVSSVRVLASGQGEFRMPDPDGHREYVRANKPKGLVNKVMTAQEAIAKFVGDGDYIVYDHTYLQRGPSALIREVIRQRKKDLWVGAKYTWVTSLLLVTGGCASRIDVGFMGLGAALMRAVEQGRVKVTEWTNQAMTMRLHAGAMGLPFIPVRFLGGTGSFEYSGAKLIEDPYTGQSVCLLPALNPDVALVHVNQCDIYGNARIFGSSTSPQETAMSARKLVISTEEIVDSDELRRDPGRIQIPYFIVDAVVEAPFGAYPGCVPGLYADDPEHIVELVRSAPSAETMGAYLEKYVHSVESHEEFLEKRVGLPKLLELRRQETIKEGYHV